MKTNAPAVNLDVVTETTEDIATAHPDGALTARRELAAIRPKVGDRNWELLAAVRIRIGLQGNIEDPGSTPRRCTRQGFTAACISGSRCLIVRNLALFVDAKHQGPLRRIEVEANNVTHFLNELRIGRQLESLAAMWSQ